MLWDTAPWPHSSFSSALQVCPNEFQCCRKCGCNHNILQYHTHIVPSKVHPSHDKNVFHFWVVFFVVVVYVWEMTQTICWYQWNATCIFTSDFPSFQPPLNFNPVVIELLHSLIRFATRIVRLTRSKRSITSRWTESEHQRLCRFFSFLFLCLSIVSHHHRRIWVWVSRCLSICWQWLFSFISNARGEREKPLDTSFCCGLMLLWPYLRMWKTNTTQQMAIRNEKIVENMGVALFSYNEITFSARENSISRATLFVWYIPFDGF